MPALVWEKRQVYENFISHPVFYLSHFLLLTYDTNLRAPGIDAFLRGVLCTNSLATDSSPSIISIFLSSLDFLLLASFNLYAALGHNLYIYYTDIPIVEIYICELLSLFVSFFSIQASNLYPIRIKNVTSSEEEQFKAKQLRPKLKVGKWTNISYAKASGG